MFAPEAVRPGERADCFYWVGLRRDPCFTISPLELDKQAPLMIKGAFRLSAKEIRLAHRVFHIRRDISFSGAVWLER